MFILKHLLPDGYRLSVSSCCYPTGQTAAYSGSTFLLDSVDQFLRQLGHSAVLRADVGTHLYGQLVSFRDRHAGEDGGCKGTREGVAGPDGIGYLYLCLLYTSPSPRDQRGSRMPSSA